MIQIREISAEENWENIRKSFYQSLTSPFDGMWDELVHDHSQLWGIYDDDKIIGYCSKDEVGNLNNFFLIEKYRHLKNELFKRVLYVLETRQAIVSTNNSDFLILSLDKSKKMTVHTYLFENEKEITLPKPAEIEGSDLKLAQTKDIQNLINFCCSNTDTDPNLLEPYINRLVDRQEIYLLEKEKKMIGSCEIRKSLTQAPIADLGVIIHTSYRKKGIGSWLMAKAKEICLTQGNTPICSCEHGNIGSKKMMENAGFISNNMIIRISF